MKLQEFLKLDWVVDLREVFDTRIPVDQWKQTGNNLRGTIIVNDETFVIVLEPTTFEEFTMINIAFEKIIDGVPTQELQIHSRNASMIIGAIRHAVMEKLQEFEYDALVFTAQDNHEKRMRIYNSLVSLFKNSFAFRIDNIETIDSRGRRIVMTALITHSVPPEKVQSLIQKLSGVGKISENVQIYQTSPIRRIDNETS